jgi:ribosomal protein L40E
LRRAPFAWEDQKSLKKLCERGLAMATRDYIEAVVAAAWNANGHFDEWNVQAESGKKAMIDAAVAEAERRGLMGKCDRCGEPIRDTLCRKCRLEETND